MTDLSPALIEELAVNLRVADPEPFDGLDDRAYYRKFAEGFAPILSRALTEAYREGVEAREYAAAVDAYAANPYLTEKEQQ